MAEEDDSQKTEEPSAKKLAKAREEGQAATSQEIKSWFILLGGSMAMVLMAPGIMHDIRVATTRFIESPHAIATDLTHLHLVMIDMLREVGLILAPLLGLLMVLAFASNVGQVGLMWAPKKIKPDLNKISLIKGIKNKFSMRTIVEFVKGIAKISLVSVVAFGLALPLLRDIPLLPSFEVVQTLDRIHIIAINLMLGAVAVMTVIALFDFVFQKYSFKKKMRMSKQEVKDEHKQSEGDPQIKARIRQIRMSRAQQRMMAAVPEADVVITNPTHFAVAMKYDMETMAAPKVVAKGVDTLALRIRDMAEAHEVPVVENPPLARALYAAVELDAEIPEEHYKAVAEVIGYVMRLRGDLPEGDKETDHRPEVM